MPRDEDPEHIGHTEVMERNEGESSAISAARKDLLESQLSTRLFSSRRIADIQKPRQVASGWEYNPTGVRDLLRLLR